MNKHIIKLIILFAIAAVAWSCEKTVVLDLDQTESKVIIEGLVTNKPGYQYVKLSRSVDFYSSEATPRITDGIVTVSDDEGNVFAFEHNPGGDADSTGFYKPETPFVGEIGRTYTLQVLIDGVEYQASDYLYPVTAIDSIRYRVNQNEKDDPEEEGRYFELLLFTKEPQETKDFYFFKMYRNDSLTYDSDSDIYYSDDRFIAENIDGIALPVFFSEGDTGRMEMYSISRNGYIFYNDLWSLLNNDGGISGPPPANPRTNLNNGAMGFFQVSAVVVSETVTVD